MKKQWMVVAVVALGVSFGASRASAQGPAGAGAASAADTSSHASHSYNPIKWVKKDSKTNSDLLDANSDQNKKLTAYLQTQGVISANSSVAEACASFKVVTDCVAALRASHNLGLDFSCIKANVTGVLTGEDTSACRRVGGDKGVSLDKAIHLLKPEINAKAAAKDAESQARTDVKQAQG